MPRGESPRPENLYEKPDWKERIKREAGLYLAGLLGVLSPELSRAQTSETPEQWIARMKAEIGAYVEKAQITEKSLELRVPPGRTLGTYDGTYRVAIDSNLKRGERFLILTDRSREGVEMDYRDDDI